MRLIKKIKDDSYRINYMTNKIYKIHADEISYIALTEEDLMSCIKFGSNMPTGCLPPHQLLNMLLIYKTLKNK